MSKELNVLEIINDYESLKKGLKYLVYNNKSNNAPYHNFNHLLTVTKHCYRALSYMDMLGDVKCEMLLLSALFHDFNHSMGKEKDDVNIQQAKLGLFDFCVDSGLNLDFPFMCGIIDATQYPYVIEAENLTIYQAIIRDADLCQVLEYDWIKQVILGLSEEMNISVGDMIVGQRKFVESVKFITDYGKFIQNTKYDKVISDSILLENILK